MTAFDQLAAAVDHCESAAYFAGDIGDKPHNAVTEIDAALRLLHAARQQLVTENVRRDKALLAQLAAFDTYRDNIAAGAR